MGRPLFSSTLKAISVVDHPEPESVCPYEKWSHRNAFDPDADEFFDNEHTVYEAFIDPADAAAVFPPSGLMSSSSSPYLSSEEEEHEEEELRDTLLAMPPPFAAPLLGPDDIARPMPSPMAVGADDPAHLVVDDLDVLTRSLGLVIGQRRSRTQPSDSGSASESQLSPGRANSGGRRVRMGDPRWSPHHRRAVSGPDVTSTSTSPLDYATDDGENVGLSLPPSTAPIPVPGVRARRTTFVDEASYHSPATPPRQLLPSPPPTVSPRLYSWARHPISTASSPGTPFGNPHARTSYAHLSPALVRVRDALF